MLLTFRTNFKVFPSKETINNKPPSTIPSTINQSFSSESSHSNESNSSSSFTFNDCSHLSSLHKDHNTIRYSQPELFFIPDIVINIYSTFHHQYINPLFNTLYYIHLLMSIISSVILLLILIILLHISKILTNWSTTQITIMFVLHYYLHLFSPFLH